MAGPVGDALGEPAFGMVVPFADHVHVVMRDEEDHHLGAHDHEEGHDAEGGIGADGQEPDPRRSRRTSPTPSCPARPCRGGRLLGHPSARRRSAVTSSATQAATPWQAASASAKQRTNASSSPYHGSSISSVPASTAVGSNSRNR